MIDPVQIIDDPYFFLDKFFSPIDVWIFFLCLLNLAAFSLNLLRKSRRNAPDAILGASFTFLPAIFWFAGYASKDFVYNHANAYILEFHQIRLIASGALILIATACHAALTLFSSKRFFGPNKN